MNTHIINFLVIILILTSSCQNNSESDISSNSRLIETDVCVYGATASGITAAMAVKKEGKSVIIIEPSRWVGGILVFRYKTHSGLPQY